MNLIASISNVGVIRQADVKLGGLTVLCGANNSGKTYITHSIFGFLDRLQRGAAAPVLNKIVIPVEREGSMELDIDSLQTIFQEAADKISEATPELLSSVFASERNRFRDSNIKIDFNEIPRSLLLKYSLGFAGESWALNVSQSKSNTCIFSLAKRRNDVEGAEASTPQNSEIFAKIIRREFSTRLQAQYFPRVFICSAERTGASIFQKELDFSRSRMIDLLTKMKDKSGFDNIGQFAAQYPLAVRSDVDFARSLSSYRGRKGLWATKNEDVLNDFADIVEGEYVAVDGDMRFVPKVKVSDVQSLKLTESSSSVRALMDMVGYLKYVIKPGDILVVDEPEMNLYPENQRKIARLFAALVNTGVNVFITTHSDYLLRELNLLVLLKSKKAVQMGIGDKYGYKSNQLLSSESLNVYRISDDPEDKGMKVVSPVAITQDEGMRSSVFDASIDEMNRIFDEIYWG